MLLVSALSQIAGKKGKRARRFRAAQLAGPQNQGLGNAEDSISLGAARWSPRRSSTIYQSPYFPESRRVIGDTITQPMPYSSVAPTNPAFSPPMEPSDPLTGLPWAQQGLNDLRM